MEMVRLEIHGENADEFLANARKTLAVFGQPGTPDPVFAKADAVGETTLGVVTGAEVTVVDVDNVDIFPPGEVLTTGNSAVVNSDHAASVEALDKPEEAKPRRGRPTTKKQEPEPQEVQGAEPEPDNSNPAPVATYDIDKDLRPRVREILKGFEDREYARRSAKKGSSKDTDKSVMEASVAYCRPLFTAMGVAKISDLPADKFAAFMAESQKYLDDLKGE